MITKRKLLPFLVVVMVVLVGWLCLRNDVPKRVPPIGDAATVSNAVAPVLSGQPGQSNDTPHWPTSFKYTNYPPESDERKALWAWWHRMEKLDPGFEWKMPISFYGKVVDQFGASVSNASGEFTWTVIGGSRQRTVESDAGGRFSIDGISGKRLGVDVFKTGFLRTRESRQSFEYAEFFDARFHVPDPAKPVVFRLQRLLGADPMYKHIPSGRIPLNEGGLALDAASGRFGDSGDVAFQVQAEPREGGDERDYVLTLKAIAGAAFALSEEEFLFEAPESGYTTEHTIKCSSGDRTFRPTQRFRFYLKTRGGRYAAVEAQIALLRRASDAQILAVVYYNPSGSRNLEFDHRKWLNR
jgi:hypothetical protein